MDGAKPQKYTARRNTHLGVSTLRHLCPLPATRINQLQVRRHVPPACLGQQAGRKAALQRLVPGAGVEGGLHRQRGGEVLCVTGGMSASPLQSDGPYPANSTLSHSTRPADGASSVLMYCQCSPNACFSAACLPLRIRWWAIVGTKPHVATHCVAATFQLPRHLKHGATSSRNRRHFPADVRCLE